MTSMPPFELSNAMREWVISHWPQASTEPLSMQVLAGDAGHRRYCRVMRGVSRCMLVSVPPDTEGHEDFVAVRRLLESGEVRVPALYAQSADQGLLLLEDLGDTLLLDALNADTVDSWYKQAGQLQCRLGGLKEQAHDIENYSAVLLKKELHLFMEWFVSQLLGISPNADDDRIAEALYDVLLASALEQPQVLVHRDFHSRNIMVIDRGELATIDFQDAVIGPLTYDGVSLLRDCYVRWPAEQVRHWALAQKAAQQAAGLLGEVDDARYLRWFDWMGLQRHLKVLGVFARLHLRDGKSGYLQDLPLVITYVREVLADWSAQEPLCGEFLAWFDRRLGSAIDAAPWYR